MTDFEQASQYAEGAPLLFTTAREMMYANPMARQVLRSQHPGDVAVRSEALEPAVEPAAAAAVVRSGYLAVGQSVSRHAA